MACTYGGHLCKMVEIVTKKDETDFKQQESSLEKIWTKAVQLDFCNQKSWQEVIFLLKCYLL